MSEKFTSGPWKFGKCLSMRSDEWVVAYDTYKGRGIQIALVDSGSANACLIAAAPDLYAALKDAAGLLPYGPEREAAYAALARCGGAVQFDNRPVRPVPAKESV